MTSTDFILLLTNTESVLQKKRTRSLARAQWADVLEVDAQIALCGQLRKQVTEQATHTQPTTVAEARSAAVLEHVCV